MSTANKLLRQFYGLDAPDRENETRDIDSPGFEARTFFEESIRSDSLPQLLARENALVSDIRSFDNDLQTLVYDNYSKFLGASDTVRSLGSNIATLSDEMTRLKTNLAGVAEHSSEIGTDLEPNRQRIQRLVGISRLLGRVEFISKLPEQLRLCLKTEKYGAAVNVWTKVEGILTTQQHFPSFQRIHEECKAIMEDIWGRVRGQMLNMDVAVADSVEFAVLLVKLKTPLGTVCSQLAHHWFLVIDNTLEYGDVGEEPFAALSALKKLAVDDAAEFVRLYKERLVELEVNEVEKAKINGIILDFMNNAFDRGAQLLPMKELFTLDCRKVAAYLTLFADVMAAVATEQQISKHLHGILQQYMEAKTMKVYDDLIASMDGKRGMDLYEHITTVFVQSCSYLIRECEVLVMMNHKECSHFLVQQMSLMFDRVFNMFKTSDSENALSYAVVTQVFADKHIPDLFEQLATLEGDSPLQALQESLFRMCKSTGNVCLERFVAHRRLALDRLVVSSISGTEWATVDKEPTAPSASVRGFVKYIAGLRSEVCELIGILKCTESVDSDSASWQKRSVLRSTSFYAATAPTFVGVREDGIHQIDRLFTSVNRLHLSQALDFDVRSIVGSVMMYSMKTMLELVRVERFSNAGFNQMQIDGFILYYAYYRKAHLQELFAALIEEIISSAGDGTVDLVPLDLDTLESIRVAFENSEI